MESPTGAATTQQVRIHGAYESFKHNASIAMLVVAPVLIAIPPRKLDLYTFSLAGVFVASANQLNVERTGKGLLSQFGYGQRNAAQRAVEVNQERRPSTTIRSTAVTSVSSNNVRTQQADSMGVTESIEAKTKDIWMGAETEGWKERRLKTEQEKLDRGEGYGSMIMDQIWEVWNWGENKGEELKQLDQKVVDQERTT